MMIETAFVLTFWLLSGLSFLMVAAGLVQVWQVIERRKNPIPPVGEIRRQSGTGTTL